MHPNSTFCFAKHARAFVRGRVLEIGPEDSSTTLRDLSRNWTYWHTADICAGSHLTFPECDPYAYPVAPHSFDTAVSANVIEHVREPWTWMKELKRIVRPGGYIIVVTPANWVYHPDPVDCWRVWPEGMTALFKWAGLVPVVAVAENLDPGMDWVIDTVGVARC
jgi:SAM-dependent methyltransferase